MLKSGEMRGYARGMVLAGLVAGSVMLPAVGAAATQDKKPVTATAPAAEKHKVSPYVIASRHHLEAAKAEGAHSMQRPVGQPMRTHHVRGKAR